MPRDDLGVTLGRADRQVDLFDDAAGFCEQSLPENSIYRFLARERDRLFPDELFADLFTDRGRRSVPPSVVATVMVLQRLDGLSDREAVDRYAFDVRWRYAAGVGGYAAGGWSRFAHTVLVDMRERLRRSARPNRIFEVGLAAAAAAGLVGRRRVLDSTPLYDAVATADTVTLIRSALRGLLAAAAAADFNLAAALHAVLTSDDGYASRAKPQIDWDDPVAREELIDSRARDGFAVLAALDGRELADPVGQAAALLATVLGQDLETGEDGVFRIARRVAKDRVISTVDPDARHGHKTAARGFDGYKGHAAADPDSEIITATTVTPGNAGDATVAEDLIADLLGEQPKPPQAEPTATDESTKGPAKESAKESAKEPTKESAEARPTVYGDNAYGTGEFHSRLARPGSSPGARPKPQPRPGGCSVKTASPLISARRRCAAQPGTPPRSGRPAPVAEPPTSARCAPGARCGRTAAPPRPAARSPSARTSTPSPTRAPGRPTPLGSPTTDRPAPRSNASSGT